MKLSRRALRRWGRISGGLLVTLLALGGLYRLGRAVTPVTGAPLPPLYAPAVRQTETYRRQARAWLAALQARDAGLVALVAAAQPMDVYALANTGQQELQAAAEVSQAISRTYPPAALVSLRDSLQAAADAYLEAAFAVNRWVGEPTEDTYLAALETLRLARTCAARAAGNPWLDSPAGPPPAPPAPERLNGWQP